MRDTVNILRQGIPSVALVHAPFQGLARGQLGNLGVREVETVLLVYPQDHPTGDSPELVIERAREVADRLPAMIASQRWGPR